MVRWNEIIGETLEEYALVIGPGDIQPLEEKLVNPYDVLENAKQYANDIGVQLAYSKIVTGGPHPKMILGVKMPEVNNGQPCECKSKICHFQMTLSVTPSDHRAEQKRISDYKRAIEFPGKRGICMDVRGKCADSVRGENEFPIPSSPKTNNKRR